MKVYRANHFYFSPFKSACLDKVWYWLFWAFDFSKQEGEV